MKSETQFIKSFSSLELGDCAKVEKYINEKDVEEFSSITGDENPIHTDSEFAENTIFGARIVHGVLLNGIVSTTLADLPGTVIYMSKETEFLKPIYIGTKITVESTISEKLGSKRYLIKSVLFNEEDEVALRTISKVQIE